MSGFLYACINSECSNFQNKGLNAEESEASKVWEFNVLGEAKIIEASMNI